MANSLLFLYEETLANNGRRINLAKSVQPTHYEIRDNKIKFYKQNSKGPVSLNGSKISYIPITQKPVDSVLITEKRVSFFSGENLVLEHLLWKQL